MSSPRTELATAVDTLCSLLIELPQTLERHQQEINYTTQDLIYIAKIGKLVGKLNITPTFDRRLLFAFRVEVLIWYFGQRFALLKDLVQRAEKAYTHFLGLVALFRINGPNNIPPEVQPLINRLILIFKRKLNNKRNIAASTNLKLDSTVQKIALKLDSTDKEQIAEALKLLEQVSSLQTSPSKLEAQMLAILVYLTTQTPLTGKDWIEVRVDQNFPKTQAGQFSKFNRYLSSFYYLHWRNEQAKFFLPVVDQFKDQIVKLINEADIINMPIILKYFDQEEKRRARILPGYAELASSSPHPKINLP